MEKCTCVLCGTVPIGIELQIDELCEHCKTSPTLVLVQAYDRETNQTIDYGIMPTKEAIGKFGYCPIVQTNLLKRTRFIYC